MNEIVVGIDIGATSAIAIFDRNENLLFLKSKKEYSLSEIIKDIISFGKPILICTDKVKIPFKIKKIASSFSCKIFHPIKEPKEKSKIRLTKNFNYKNVHERDAIYSALKGLKSIKNKIIVKKEEIKVNKTFSEKKVEKLDDRDKLVRRIIELKEENKRLKEIIEKLKERKNFIIQEVKIEKNEALEKKIEILEKIIEILKVWNKKDYICLKLEEIDYEFLKEVVNHLPAEKIVIASNDIKNASVLVELGIKYIITEKKFENYNLNILIDNLNNYSEIENLSKEKINSLLKEKIKELINEKNYY
ncbi:MAG: DUF460 domain-containing protein [Candidatus Aenigmatarchaeota archaeon]